MRPSLQLELDLSPMPRWGGRRTGAGRKRGPNPRVPHLRRPALSKHVAGHVTLRMRRGLPSLRQPRLVREFESQFRAARERGAFRLVQYSIQRNHVHLLVEADGPGAIARGMMSIGARIARAVNRVFRRRGAVLADRYHLRILRTPREVRNALAYVLCNFRKHAAETWYDPRTANPEIDPGSSARWFSGWKGLARALPPPAEIPPVAPARSWLLRAGWWRHGPIDPNEVPGARR